MIQKIDIPQFLEQQQSIVIDVRSPIEYNHAHIPNAINIPLFNDEERKIVGTAYKEQGRQTAIKIGLDFFGPKMKSIVEEVEKKMKELKNEENERAPTEYGGTGLGVTVHCARGGMRSAAMAWLLNLYGFEVTVIIGGYKAYRNWVLEQFVKTYNFKLLGGYTGSNKTTLLNQLATTNNVIDLEYLANHKGSAFGSYNMPKQTSNEMFENKLAMALVTVSKNSESIWLEDESNRIGFNQIPKGIWEQMRNANVYFLNVPFEERLQNILNTYGNISVTDLQKATLKITKQLGGLETKNVINYLEEGNIKAAFAILLKYYDKYYKKGVDFRESNKIVHCTMETLQQYFN